MILDDDDLEVTYNPRFAYVVDGQRRVLRARELPRPGDRPPRARSGPRPRRRAAVSDDPRPTWLVPDGAMVTGVVMVAGYIDANGKNRYALSTKGDVPYSTLLGLTVYAQRDLLDLSR